MEYSEEDKKRMITAIINNLQKLNGRFLKAVLVFTNTLSE